jgi:hypothetical protein
MEATLLHLVLVHEVVVKLLCHLRSSLIAQAFLHDLLNGVLVCHLHISVILIIVSFSQISELNLANSLLYL